MYYGMRRNYVRASRKRFTYRLGNSNSGRAYGDPAPDVAVLVKGTAYTRVNGVIGLRLKTATDDSYLVHSRPNYGLELIGAVVVLEPVPLVSDRRRDGFLEHLWRIKE